MVHWCGECQVTFVFFFKQQTAYELRISDWSSGVCSSDLFHVNGDDPEAVVHASRIAIEFRQQFKKDVVVDMFCYRRFGHNEGDEPGFTQPLMYKSIAGHPTTREIYAKRLVAEGVLTEDEPDAIVRRFHRSEERRGGKEGVRTCE